MKALKEIMALLLVVAVLTLAGCSSGGSASKSGLQDTQVSARGNAVVSGTTKDKELSIMLTTIGVTTSTNTKTGTITNVYGTFELKNLTDSPIPTASVYFGVLDKESNSPYWGSVQINTLDKIDPKANVQGSFTVQLPAGVDVKNCDLIFGPLPKITFEAPIPIEK